MKQLRGQLRSYVEREIVGYHPNYDACVFESPPCCAREQSGQTHALGFVRPARVVMDSSVAFPYKNTIFLLRLAVRLI